MQRAGAGVVTAGMNCTRLPVRMPGLDDPAPPSFEGAAESPRPRRASPGDSPDGAARSAAVQDDSSKRGTMGERLHTSPIGKAASGPQAKPVVAAPAKVVAPPNDPMIGSIIAGRYRVEARLGEGGMGAVYRVEHTHMRKKLALKVLHREMTSQPEIVARFEREAMAAAHIEHPNVACATDFGKLEDGTFFLVLEYVEGTSLRQLIDKGPLDPGRSIHVATQILAGLRRAHEFGIVHRDLKPENVLLVDKDGDPDYVKVLDFGIARVPIGSLISGGDAGPSLTRAGMVYGTPEYMAPEQALGQPVDQRADLYALGVMMYEMLTGARPFDHESKVTLLGMQVTAPIPRMDLRAPDAHVPPSVEAIVGKLLEKEAQLRFADAKEFVDAVSAVSAQLVASGHLAGPLLTTGPMSGVRSSFASVPKIANGSSASLPSFAGAPTVLPHSNLAVSEAIQDRARERERERAEAETRPKRAIEMRTVVAAGGALGVVAIALLVLVIAYIVKRGGANGPTTVTSATSHGVSGEASSVPDGPAAEGAPASFESLLVMARSSIDRGNFAVAVDALAPLEQKFPKNSDVHRLLEKAYAGEKNPVATMREAELWIESDPKAGEDLKLLEDVRNTALVGRDGSDAAFGLLEEKLGTAGIDILYDVAWLSSGQLYPAAARRARLSLQKPEVRALANQPLLILLDFRDAKSCEQKHELLGRARDDGDARLLAALKPYQAVTGCGFLHRRDCFPCMRRDHALGDAVAAIEGRAAK